MTFFQVLTTNEFSSSLDRQFTSVFNYATLAEAMKHIKAWEYKVADGITFEQPITGREMVQQHLNYVDDGGAVIEIRYEFLNDVPGCSMKQFSTQQALYIKEIIL